MAEEEKAQVRFDRYFGGQPHKMLRKSRSVRGDPEVPMLDFGLPFA